MPKTTNHLTRRNALRLVGGTSAAIAMPGVLTQVTAQGLDKFSYQTNWRAQAEHGGFYLGEERGPVQKVRHRY